MRLLKFKMQKVSRKFKSEKKIEEDTILTFESHNNGYETRNEKQ